MSSTFLICLQAASGRCSVKVGVPGGFAGFTVERLCRGLFSNKVAGLRPADL